MTVMWLTALMLQSFALVYGYKMYQDQIPNGGKVPHPCKPNYLWDGVGHKNENGGGSRNPFGLDFAANNYKWDATLCQKDSDGDGLTNGQELGDPNCVWTTGSPPSQSSGLTHPGVCEPLTSPTCMARNDWEFCNSTAFNCSQTSDAGVKNMTFSMNKTTVPAQETNYYCQLFNLPSDQDYHIIANEPAIDNKYVTHHMILFGCATAVDLSTSTFRTPQPCGMNNGGSCGDIIATWTLGSNGKCLTGPIGIRIGNSTFKQALLQIHWNNPAKKTDYVDSSGMTIHYTPILRQYDIGILTVGQLGLTIPPGRSTWEQNATCPSSCTQSKLTSDININEVALHMHYLGKAGSVHQYRNGEKVTDLAVELSYSYDTPLPIIHDPVKIMKAGDELRLSCSYKSTDQSSIVYYGDSTQAEMCFAFISYYPKISFPGCLALGSTTMCDLDEAMAAGTGITIGGCQIKGGAEMIGQLSKIGMACDMTGASCWSNCRYALSAVPCLTGDARFLTELVLGKVGAAADPIVKALRSCDNEIYGFGHSTTLHHLPIFMLIGTQIACFTIIAQNVWKIW